MRTFWICLLLLLSNLLQAQLSEQQFLRPESIYAPRVVWHWVNGNVTRVGINLDLEAIAATGLGGGILFNTDEGAPAGPILYRSAEWTELTFHAFKQADRLGLKLLFHYIPAYSCTVDSGISLDNAQQEVVWSEAFVRGGESIDLPLPKPTINQHYYKDIAVLAYPCLKGEEQLAQNMHKKEGITVGASTIVDLTNLTDSEGQLNWDVPKGNWTIVRIGYTVGYDEPRFSGGIGVDKLCKNGLQQQYDLFLKPLFEQTRPFHGRSFEGVILDSCTVGRNVWTRDMLSEFQKRAGYDLKTYLLAYTGRYVNSTQETERFFWDLERIQSGMQEEYYYGSLRSLLQKEGLSLLVSGFQERETSDFSASPSEMKTNIDLAFVQRLNQVRFSDFEHQPHPTAQPGMVMGLHGASNNRNNTWFSKATNFLQYFSRCQYILQSGVGVADAAYFLGEEVDGSIKPINRKGHAIDVLSRKTLLQRTAIYKNCIVLPDGMSYRFLLLPNVRTMSLPMLQKLKALLEDGLWISAIKPTSWTGLLTIKEQAAWESIVEDLWGKLPDGVYRYGSGRLFINMDAEKLYEEALLKPDFEFASSSPPSVINYLHRRIGSEDAWFVCNNRNQNDTVLASFRITGMQPEWWNPQTGEIHPIHIFRQHDEKTLIPLTLEPSESGFVVFRKPLKQTVYDGLMSGSVPFISANPDYFQELSPTCHQLDSSLSVRSKSVLPEVLALAGNRFFRKKGRYSYLNPGLPPEKQPSLIVKKDLPVYDLSTNWIVHFPEGKGAPEQFIMDSLTSLHTVKEFGVKYFSGTASWQKSFNLTPKDLIGTHLILDLGEVAILAEVYVNGKSAGICWKKPFRLDVTDLLKSGENQLDVRVTNLWVNRLIGDEFLPAENEYDAWGEIKSLPDWYKNNLPKTGERITFVTWKQYDQNSPLAESGLVGPVTLSVWKVLKD